MARTGQIMRIGNQEPAYLEMVIPQAADYNLVLAIVQTASPRVLLNFSGWTAVARVRAEYGGSVLIEMTTSNGGIDLSTQGTSPDNYNCHIYIPSATTAILNDWGTGVWDIRFRDSLGRAYKWVAGPAYLSRSAA